jgi:hypothetical protein
MRRRETLRVAAALGVLMTLLGCERPAAGPLVRARFGVFFGGQVQERDAVPLILDRARQNIGVRLEFEEPAATPARVSWELEKPALTDKSGKSQGSVVDYGEARTRPGEAVLDVPLAFRAGDRPGAWRIRVALDGKSVLDRAFQVVPASAAED